MPLNNSLSVYIHIPFCRTRCGYCDFNTYAGMDYLKDAYVKKVIEEISKTANKIVKKGEVKTIYFGGGTPNLLSTDQLGGIIKQISSSFPVGADIEVTTEANPLNLSKAYLSRLIDIGINRLSLGMQSAFDSDLKVLGRRHVFEDVEASVENAKRAGFNNISLDLIFGIPRQTLSSFAKTLESAINLGVSHLSLYALTVEESTPLAAQIAKSQLPAPDDDLAAEMYILAMDALEKRGFSQYEISNWSHEDQNQCLHNLQYWRNHEYLGFGAGAHSHYGHTRWENHKAIKDYIKAVSQISENTGIISPAGINKIKLSESDEISETMMMGMRLTKEGVCSENFQNRFGVALETVYTKEILQLIDQGLVEWVNFENQKILRLTKKGRLLGNQVFMQFIRD